ncbi:hypothetical protein IWZ03DRAFT_377233 [Phyllosticta citriasiana]|uniref:Secreted protein n=1 Tax=Phyllosticta citriasiana TaxID=595635 RepID=A0ABR1KMY7_9PEZI
MAFYGGLAMHWLVSCRPALRWPKAFSWRIGVSCPKLAKTVGTRLMVGVFFFFFFFFWHPSFSFCLIELTGDASLPSIGPTAYVSLRLRHGHPMYVKFPFPSHFHMAKSLTT